MLIGQKSAIPVFVTDRAGLVRIVGGVVSSANMASDDVVLAQMFAAEYKDQLSWRKQEHVPGRPHGWYWRKPPVSSWLSDPDGAVARKFLSEYVGRDDVFPRLTYEDQKRVLELVKKELSKLQKS